MARPPLGARLVRRVLIAWLIMALSALPAGPGDETLSAGEDLAALFPSELGGVPVDVAAHDWDWLTGVWEGDPAGDEAIGVLRDSLAENGLAAEDLEVALAFTMTDFDDAEVMAYRARGMGADALLEGLTPLLQLDYVEAQTGTATVAGRVLTTLGEAGSDVTDPWTRLIHLDQEVVWTIRATAGLMDEAVSKVTTATATRPLESPGAADPIGTPDPMRVALLLEDGMEPGEAEILALTDVTIISAEPTRTTLRMTLPWGDVIDTTISIDPDAVGEVGLPEVASTVTADGIDVRLDYFVSRIGIPADVWPASEAGRQAGLLAAVGGFATRTADVDVVQVEVDWAIKKATGELRGRSINAVLDRFLPGTSGAIMPIIKVGLTADEGLELGLELDKQLAQLDALRRCAESPTNELTRRLYQEEPGEKERVLQEIDAARVDLVANSLVMQLGVLNKLAASFGPKWLGWVAGPTTAWSKATLKDLNKQRVAELDRAIPKCADECPAGTVSQGGGSNGGSGGSSGGGSTGGSGEPSMEACVFPVTISGTVEFEFRDGGRTVATGRATGLVWRYDPSGSGGNSSTYELEAGRYEWSLDDEYQVGGSGCVHRMDGSGTEDLVPDEAGVPWGEMTGPGLPDEFATIIVQWVDDFHPAPYFMAIASVQLHGEWVTSDSCLGELHRGDANWPGHRGLNDWFGPVYDPFPAFQAQMTGEHREGDEAYGQSLWRWELTASG